MNEIIVSEEYNRAVTVHRKICTNAQMAQESLYEVCKGLKEMRDDKLYKELGYQNFEDYTENEVGIKRRQAYTYIQIASGLSQDFVQSTAQIGTQKLALLAKLDEPEREEVQATVSVEDVSVKELKAKIKELEAAKSKLIDEVKHSGDEKKEIEKMAENALKKAVSEKNKLQNERDKLESELAEKGSALDKLDEEAAELRRQIEELENRPRDTYEDTTKIDELKKQLAEAEERHRQELANVRPEPVEDVKGVFKAYMSAAVDSLKRLTEFTTEHSDAAEKELFIQKLGTVDVLINQAIKRLRGE